METKVNKLSDDFSGIKIGSVKMVNEGMKGLKVEYVKEEKVGERWFVNEYKPKLKHPVQEELLECFDWLKKHMLEICGYEVVSSTMRALKMTGVKAGEGGFVLMGKMEVFGNGKVVSLVTPYVVSEEEYEGYEDVMKIVNGVYEETKKYLSKTVMMSDKQLVMKFRAKEGDFNKEDFMRLPEVEQKKMATEVLTKMKCIVIAEEELEIPDFTGLKEEQAKEEGRVVEDYTKLVPEKAPVIKEEVAAQEEDDFNISNVIEDGDDFDLGFEMEPVPVSTAKRK